MRRAGRLRQTVVVLLLSHAAVSQTGQLVPTSTGHPDPSVLSLREMEVDAGIGRGYARVNVRQVFENHTAVIQEGTWRFALPASGAVGDFAVWDGLTRIPGVILEKRRARAIYRDLTQRRIDPGLLQQGEEEDREPGGRGRPAERPSGGAAFSVKIAPIPALGTKRLELQYQQEVPWVDGVGEFRIPLRPGDGAPPTARTLRVRIVLLDGRPEAPVSGSLPLSQTGGEAAFSGTDVKLEKDVVLRFRPASSAPLVLSTFRNPAGVLPDGLALAPWERPSEIPPEKDGFFLVEYWPGAHAATTRLPAEASPTAAPRPPIALALLFDTSLSHRWTGLEAAYGELVKILGFLEPTDRFVLVPFDRKPSTEPAGLPAATPEEKEKALAFLRSRPLAPGTDVAAAVRAAARAAGPSGRIVLLTDGAGPSGGLDAARSGLPLFTILTGEETREGYAVASAAVLSLATATASSGETAESTLFYRRLFGTPAATSPAKPAPRKGASGLPVALSGGDPKLRDVYPVLTQPPTHGSLSGWVGRYAAPAAAVTLSFPDVPGSPSVSGSFPETALDARDLPRRWARARVDELLRRIELEGERREWVEEILALSRRYKFVTPYTAFLAAPRSLLRPRRIQPGDPVIRVEVDPGIVAATALLPFGKRIHLEKRPRSHLWEGRFLVPEGLPDGRMPVRLVLRDVTGRTLVETKHLVIDGTPPVILPDPVPSALGGRPLRVSVRADADVIFLAARLGDGPPVPLRWDGAARRSTGEVFVPPGPAGIRDLFFEAADAAGNHGFARTTVDVR